MSIVMATHQMDMVAHCNGNQIIIMMFIVFAYRTLSCIKKNERETARMPTFRWETFFASFLFLNLLYFQGNKRNKI